MNSESKVNVHYSSLVGLKAELLRKQAEIEIKKSEYERANLTDKIKSRSKKRDNESKRTELCNSKRKEKPEDIQNKRALEKSKLMLQAKSRLYDELSKTHINMNPNFLVDFECKPDDVSIPDAIDEEHYDSDEEWAEYTDCLGRTRKCLREDLPKMLKDDDDLKKSIRKDRDQEQSEAKTLKNETPLKEPEIEMMRRKWEEQTAKLAHKTDIHYQDVLFDEARSHGVGYYAFSQDEEERARQQENLFKLRKETEQKQKEIQEVQEMKNRMNKNRLRAARLRQRMRAGLPAEEVEKEDSEELEERGEHDTNNQDARLLSDDITETAIVSEDQASKLNQKELETESKIQAFGNLLGKRNQWYVMSQEEWIQKKRKERQEEFAPGYENFISSEASVDEIHPNPSGDELPKIIGPMPPFPNELHSNLTVESDLSATLGPTHDVSGEHIEDQIEAGLKFLRKQIEEKNG